MSETGRCLGPFGRRMAAISMALLMLSLCVQVAAAKGPNKPPARLDRDLIVTIFKIEAIDDVDVFSEADFRWEVTVSSATPSYEETITSEGTYFENDDVIYPKFTNPYYPNAAWSAYFHVPDAASVFRVEIRLYDVDNDPLEGWEDDSCDISGNPDHGDVLTVWFFTETRDWSGDDYYGDVNGYSFASGEEDTTGGMDCCIWFSVMDVGNTGSTVSGFVADGDDDYLSGAVVEVWAWLADPGSAQQAPEDQGFLLKTLSVNDGWFSWASGMWTTLTFWAKKDGYWSQRINATIQYASNSYYPLYFNLPVNEGCWVTQLAQFATVNWDHTHIVYSYSSGHKSEIEVREYVAGNGMTVLVENTVIVAATMDSDDYYAMHQTYPTSQVRMGAGITCGFYWGALDPVVSNAWLKETVPEYDTFYDIPDDWTGNWQSGSWVEYVDPYEVLSITREDSGSVELQAGLQISVSFSVPGVPVGVSVPLECTLSDTETTTETLTIQITNRDNVQHAYRCWLEGGMVLHVYEIG